MGDETPRTARLDAIEGLLAERGRSVGPVRIAAGRRGIAVGFPTGSLVHVSWWALAAVVVAVRLLRRR